LRKLLIIVLIILSLFVGLSFFANSTYFFNKYIANNIKDYGFSYSKVDGNLFNGFKVKDLKYKKELLSKDVELRFSPIKLLKKKISINKLRLIAVDKKILEKLVNDFRPKEDSNSSIDIGINFEIKDILLTINEFNLEDIKIKSNTLSVAYIDYSNNKFTVGDVIYQAFTSIGDIIFSGKYKSRVLYINNVMLTNFNLKRFLKLLSGIGSSDTNTTINIKTNPFIPNIVYVKNAKLTLSPFRFKDISSKNLKIKISNAKFNIFKYKLIEAQIDANYSGDVGAILAKVDINSSDININSINVNILKPNKLENFIKKYTTTDISSDNNFSILDTKFIKIDNSNISLKNYIYKKEKIKNLTLNSKEFLFNMQSKKLKIKNLNLSTHSTLIDANLSLSIDNKIAINSLQANSKDIDKLITILTHNKSNKENNKTNKIEYIPNKFIIKNANIDGNNLSFKPYIIHTASIKAKDISGQISDFKLVKGNLKVQVKSNWGRAFLNGKINNTNYISKGKVKVTQKLLNEYSIPLIAKNLKPLKVNGKFNLKEFDLNIDLIGKDILKKIKNIDILSSKNRIKYNYKTDNVFWSINANINSKYTGKAKLINKLTYIDRLDYHGKLTPNNKLSFAKKTGSLFDSLTLNYRGNSNNIDLSFESKKLKGILKSKKYNGGTLVVTNKGAIGLKEFINLPKKFSNTKVDKLKIEAPIKFEKILPLKGNLNIVSNLVNIKGEWSYKDSFNTKAKLKLSDNSLIKKEFKHINTKALFPINLNLITSKDTLKVNLKNSYLNLDTKYIYGKNSIDLKLLSGKTKVIANGSNKNIKIILKTNSIKRTLQDINRIYEYKNLPNINGILNLKATVKSFKNIQIVLNSPKITVNNKVKPTIIEGLKANVNYSSKLITLSNYKFKINGYKLFSDRSSKIKVSNEDLQVIELWVNNSLKINGRYNYASKQGDFNLNSSNFLIENSDIKLNLFLNNRLKLNKDKISINGKVNILNGVIKKNLNQKNISDDEDIIILQRRAKKENTKFARNIKLNLLVTNNKGIIYSQQGSHFLLKPNLKVNKEYGRLVTLKGIIKIEKGGYYILKGKKLVLQKGIITFKGKGYNPNINILMKYRGREYDVGVNILGTLNRPVLYFTSNPPLVKDQILAYLLFDDSSMAGTHSQDAMVSMISGAIAKSFLGSLGIKVEHIAIKENGFSIGKSLGKHVIIYYNQEGEKASVKTRIDITKSIHTEVKVSDESQSADIIFSKEY